MRGTQGALIVASTLQIVVGFSGLWRNVARFAKALLCYLSLKFPFSYSLLFWLVPPLVFCILRKKKKNRFS